MRECVCAFHSTGHSHLHTRLSFMMCSSNWRQLDSIPELNPPHEMMPQGNVGTPAATFRELIRLCKLPPPVVAKVRCVCVCVYVCAHNFPPFPSTPQPLNPPLVLTPHVITTACFRLDWTFPAPGAAHTGACRSITALCIHRHHGCATQRCARLQPARLQPARLQPVAASLVKMAPPRSPDDVSA